MRNFVRVLVLPVTIAVVSGLGWGWWSYARHFQSSPESVAFESPMVFALFWAMLGIVGLAVVIAAMLYVVMCAAAIVYVAAMVALGRGTDL